MSFSCLRCFSVDEEWLFFTFAVIFDDTRISGIICYHLVWFRHSSLTSPCKAIPLLQKGFLLLNFMVRNIRTRCIWVLFLKWRKLRNSLSNRKLKSAQTTGNTCDMCGSFGLVTKAKRFFELFNRSFSLSCLSDVKTTYQLKIIYIFHHLKQKFCRSSS